ncbi:hypothetical protein KQX54_019789 [Cotesia glomerata]|uniref:Uncharacterized protein n=1 Tax=Cotesia glomerata TaxID=32391 RepID=A0AAV7IXD1_COTGL|nr:hypothetical protein KQX54_019789 [Cotesia glomerata]
MMISDEMATEQPPPDVTINNVILGKLTLCPEKSLGCVGVQVKSGKWTLEVEARSLYPQNGIWVGQRETQQTPNTHTHIHVRTEIDGDGISWCRMVDAGWKTLNVAGSLHKMRSEAAGNESKPERRFNYFLPPSEKDFWLLQARKSLLRKVAKG